MNILLMINTCDERFICYDMASRCSIRDGANARESYSIVKHHASRTCSTTK